MFFLGGGAGIAPGPVGDLLVLAAIILLLVLVVTALRGASEALWQGVHRWLDRRRDARR
jgi:hypothetical protein